MSAARRALAALPVALLVAAASHARPAAAQPAPTGAPGSLAARVRLGTSVTPDTVTVGDPFVLQVRVQAPAGATVVFPDAPDSTGAVDALDPRRVTVDSTAPGAVDVTARWRLAAWDVEAQPIRLGDVVVTVDGAERRIPLGGLTVFVRSVLPADTAQRVPKPPRAPLPDAVWWLVWWPWLLAALALIALLWWLARRWRNRRRRTPADEAHRNAVAAFDRLDRLGLLEAGEHARYVALAVEVLRDYLAARLPEAVASHTSTELVGAVRAREEVPHERLGRLLAGADLVKFAAAPIGADDARTAAREARAIVDAVEEGVRAREAREAAEAAARARAEAAERRRYEEAQRRAARAARRRGGDDDAGAGSGERAA